MSKKRNMKRRGAAIAMLAVSMPVLCGFAALAIDMGMIYNTQAELQRAADAGALAAALQLGDNSDGNAVVRAKAALNWMAAQNPVLGRPLQVDMGTDFVLGQATLNTQTGQYAFTPTNNLPNAVQVRARRTASSPSGPVPLIFANIFGKSNADVSASATAVLTPRDIAFVLDLSGSHNDNSSLQYCKHMEIHNRKLWASLWDASVGEQPYQDNLPLGPAFGNMKNWGDETTGPNGINVNDPGMVKLQKGSNWSLSSDWVSQTVTAKGYSAYTAAEMAVINSSAGDNSLASYKQRVMVALGLARWDSGMDSGSGGGNNSGNGNGKGKGKGKGNNNGSGSNNESVGNGDNTIDANEILPLVDYPSNSTNPDSGCKEMGGSWSDYIDYVISSNSPMSNYNPNSYSFGDPNCRYRFGLKTLVDYIQVEHPSHSSSPGLAGSAEQPMKAVSDGVLGAIDIISNLQSNDQIGMASFAEIGYGPADKPNNMSWLTTNFGSVAAKVNGLQASMWTSTTNTAQGIDKGVEVLFNSPTSRKFASKVLILLTDGRPNQTRSNPTRYIADTRGATNTRPYTDANAAAQDAANRGVIIYTIGVGDVTTEPALQAWMSNLANIGHGMAFAASGNIEAYQQQLASILQQLGGKRPVVLAQ